MSVGEKLSPNAKAQLKMTPARGDSSASVGTDLLHASPDNFFEKKLHWVGL